MRKSKRSHAVVALLIENVGQLTSEKAGEIAKELRLGAKLTQAQLAKKLGLKQARISQIESGDITDSNLIHVAEACGYRTTLTFARKTADSI